MARMAMLVTRVTGLILASGGCDNKECCEIESPTCDCFQIGGTRDHRLPSAFQCEAICDAVPYGWERSEDENGCPILRQVNGGGSCFPHADASVDAAAVDAGADARRSDAAADAH